MGPLWLVPRPQYSKFVQILQTNGVLNFKRNIKIFEYERKSTSVPFDLRLIRIFPSPQYSKLKKEFLKGFFNLFMKLSFERNFELSFERKLKGVLKGVLNGVLNGV